MSYSVKNELAVKTADTQFSIIGVEKKQKGKVYKVMKEYIFACFEGKEHTADIMFRL